MSLDRNAVEYEGTGGISHLTRVLFRTSPELQ
jgi:hypothetical protein